MRQIVIAAMVFAAGLAGCVDTQDEPAEPASQEAPGISIDEARPDPTFGNVSVGTVAQPDSNATLLEPPQLKVGEWWRIKFESPLDGQSTEFVRVLAAIQDGQYVFGMPHEGWYKEAVIYHAPGFGDVNADLSYNTHDELFTPVKFPLTDDQTWTTRFSGGAEATATVKTNPEDQTARITFATPDRGLLGTPVGADGEPNVVLELVYDAKIHEVREFHHPTAKYTVVEHGYDFEGWVTIPRGERLVFFHGRIGPGLDISLQPAAPVETVELAGGYNRVTFILASVGLTPGGAYMEKATAPDGTAYEAQWIPHPGGFQTQFFEHKDPDGLWQLEHIVGGAGVGFVEGIAYHQYDIHLPSGAVRSDHSHEVVR